MDIPRGAPPMANPVEALAALLLADGTCDVRTIERARRVATESGQRLDKVLIQLGLVTERDLARAYASLTALALAEPASFPADPVLPELLAARFLRHARVLPLAIVDGRLHVALADPLDPFTPAAIAAATGLPVDVTIGIPVELDAALNRLYPDPTTTDDPDPAAAEPLEEDAERLKDLASEAPVIRLVNGLISRAVETLASDIHIEPFEDRLRVRYRYDGVLHEAESAATAPDGGDHLAHQDHGAARYRRAPAAAGWPHQAGGAGAGDRFPRLHHSVAVWRDRGAARARPERGEFRVWQAGLSAPVIARLDAALKLPNGIVLVTGPTGSGKTTTLYTGLLSLNSVVRKVVTVEDPIEYQLPGVNQIQVKPQIGLSFASLLRSILRQDPDVIMVGEIRDHRDRADRGAGGADRPSGAQHGAHQLGRGDRSPGSATWVWRTI